MGPVFRVAKLLIVVLDGVGVDGRPLDNPDGLELLLGQIGGLGELPGQPSSQSSPVLAPRMTWRLGLWLVAHGALSGLVLDHWLV